MTNSTTAPIACPLCHTVETTVTSAELAGGAGWRCTTCGQRWDLDRLEAVAAYARFMTARALAGAA